MVPQDGEGGINGVCKGGRRGKEAAEKQRWRRSLGVIAEVLAVLKIRLDPWREERNESQWACREEPFGTRGEGRVGKSVLWLEVHPSEMLNLPGFVSCLTGLV